MFIPHPNLADDVNRAIVQSEIEGGVFLHDLPPSTVLQIQTMHHCYTAVLLGGNDAMISGHPEFCPTRFTSPSPAPPGEAPCSSSNTLAAACTSNSITRIRHAHRHLAHPGNPRLQPFLPPLNHALSY